MDERILETDRLSKLETSGQPPLEFTTEIPVVLKEMLKGGLSILWRGYQYASDLDLDCWETAIDCDALYRAGLSPIDLRWLIARGHVECALTTMVNDQHRIVHQRNGFFAEKNTCFILTSAGAAFALQILSDALRSPMQMPIESRKLETREGARGRIIARPTLCVSKPKWDSERKELRVGKWVVKHFRWSAMNQEAILTAFEEEDWPARIDDPLPHKENQDPKERLHDTIKCLNRNHKKPLIRFVGDGTGEGILWVVRDNAEIESIRD